MTESFDAIVIGAGQAGPSLAVRLAQAGRRTILVERRMLGGTCVNDGCTPTKALVASARAAWMARNAARWGVDLGGVAVKVDMKRVKARKDAVVQESRDGLAKWIGGTANLELLIGHARFEGPKTIKVGDRVLEGKQIFVNVGARAIVPNLPGIHDGPFLTNSSIMDVDALPEHLVVLGGSYIALEFAQMYRRFGAEVTVVERGPRLIGREDQDVSQEILGMLREEGITVHLGAKAQKVEHAGGKVTLVTDQARIEGTQLLLGIGRIPNTDDLGVEHSGLKLDPHGSLEVDDQLRTNVPDIWAIGDCNGKGAFTHTSYNDYEIVAANLLDNDPRRVTDRYPIYALYTDPPLGRVGMNEAEARRSGRKVLVGKRAMTHVARARERGETHGFIKVMVDGDTKEVLGAAILGIEGDEAIHAIADVMYAKAPYTVISRAVHAHPTVSELVPTTLQSLVPLDNHDEHVQDSRMSNVKSPPGSSNALPSATATKEKQTLVEDGTRFKGSLTSTCAILVQGAVEGDVEGPAVTVSATGAISGKIATGALKSEGKIAGEFDVDSAQVSGTVESNTVIRATSLDLKLNAPNGKMQLTFGPAGRDGRRS